MQARWDHLCQEGRWCGGALKDVGYQGSRLLRSEGLQADAGGGRRACQTLHQRRTVHLAPWTSPLSVDLSAEHSGQCCRQVDCSYEIAMHEVAPVG
jgi:hypothetical protein